MSLQLALSGGAGTGAKNYYGTVFGSQTGLPPGSYSVTITGAYGRVMNYENYGSPPNCQVTGASSGSSFDMTISATIASSCTVSATNIDFGQLGILRNEATATGVVTTTCASGTNYTLSLNAGLGVGATFAARKLTRSGGSEVLGYGLYRDSGRTQVWGDGTGGSTTVAGTGTGAAQTATVYAGIPPQPAPVPGAYADTITVTLTF